VAGLIGRWHGRGVLVAAAEQQALTLRQTAFIYCNSRRSADG